MHLHGYVKTSVKGNDGRSMSLTDPGARLRLYRSLTHGFPTRLGARGGEEEHASLGPRRPDKGRKE